MYTSAASAFLIMFLTLLNITSHKIHHVTSLQPQLEKCFHPKSKSSSLRRTASARRRLLVYPRGDG